VICAIHDDHLAAKREELNTMMRQLRLAAMDGEAFSGIVICRCT
jgi:hypothetical protein